MDDKEFERVIKISIKNLPKEFKIKLKNVVITTADWPSQKNIKTLKKRDKNQLLLGLYQGIPQTKRGNYGIGPTLPDKISIFKFPLIKISRNHEELINNIKNTVIHEIAHHFGMSEEEIQKSKIK